jgi:hypothetical protein
MTRLLISALPGELRAARLDAQDRLTDLLVQRGEVSGAVGDLRLGRVRHVRKGLGAFVEIGLARPALLDAADLPAGTAEGAALPVRIVRLAQGRKGAKVKPAAAEVPSATAPPALLVRGDDPLTLMGGDLDEALCDSADLVPSLTARLPQGVPVRLAGPRPPLFDDALEAQIAALTAREVPLTGGARLLIEPVETLTAIDVDAGGSGGGFDANLAAAAEIARQVRLRALSGLIVVDFLEMRGRGQRDRLHRALLEAFAGDPVETAVFPPMPSGLVEIARQRTRPALHEALCRHLGWQAAPETEAFEALRAALAAPPAARHVLRLSPAAAAALDGTLAEARRAVEARLGAPLAVAPDDGGATDPLLLE